MKPSSLSTWAMLALRCEAGMSTAGRSMRLALRMRVSMSAIGSVSISSSVVRCAGVLPARFFQAGDEAVAGQAPEADAADAELAVDGPAAAAQPAAQLDADP